MQSSCLKSALLACFILFLWMRCPDCLAYDLKDPQYWEKESHAALLELNAGNFRKAESIYRKLAEAGADLRADDPRYPLVLARLAGALNKQGKYTEAADMGEKALELREKQAGTEHYDIALICRRLAASYYYQHKWNDANRLMKRDLELTSSKLGPESPMAARCMFNLGTMYSAQRRYHEAIELLDRAYKIQMKTLPENHMESLRTLSALGMAQTGDSAEWMNAVVNTNRSLSLAREQLAPGHPDLVDFLVHSGEAQIRQRGYCRAGKDYKEAIELRQKAVGKNHPDLLPLLERYELVLDSICRTKAAKQLRKRADRIKKKMEKK